MTYFTATFPPAPVDVRDAMTAAVVALRPVAPDLGMTQLDATTLRIGTSVTLAPAAISAVQNAVAAAVVDPAATWRVNATASASLAGAVAVLRQQAATARGTNVTAGNSVAVLQTVVNNLGVFCDRLADLLQYLNLS